MPPTSSATTRAFGQIPPAPELHRVSQGKVLSGVCAGLAAHLGVSPTTVRVIFALSCLALGSGAAAYIALTVFTDQVASPSEASNPIADRHRPPQVIPVRTIDRLLVPAAFVLCIIGVGVSPTLGVTMIFVLGGALLVWRTFGPETTEISGRINTRSPGFAQWIGMLGGLVLITIGLGFWAYRTWAHAGSESFLPALVAALALVTGVILVLIPLWLKLWSTADTAARERAATEERARIAARIHDSVLQTFTVIQRQSDQQEIARLARTQERQLRQWLFGAEESISTGTLFGGLRVACGEVEDLFGVQIRPVCVGDDVPVHDALRSLLFAGREAMVNAAKHSGCQEISVFCEIGASGVDLFVRDRGPGFICADIPEDRQGVRGSIIGRMNAVGGTAIVDSTSSGTEVSVHLPHRQPTASTPLEDQ